MLLKDYLKIKKKTTVAAAEELGISQADVSRYCNGVVPRPERMAKISEWSKGNVMANDFYEMKENGTNDLNT